MLPNVLVIGPQKAGTSWIHAYLEDRADVTLPNGVKETFYFDRYFQKGTDWYQKHFIQNSSSGVCIEVGPTYFENDLAAERAGNTLSKDTKLIVMLRDPAKRVWSLYQHEIRYGYTTLPFRKAVLDRKLYKGSQYHAGIERWTNAFPQANLRYWSMLGDLAKDAQGFADDLCNFLELEKRPLPIKLQGKVFEGGAARSPLLAKMSTKIGDTLRSYRLYPLINKAKNLGLKEFIYGSPQSQKKTSLTEDDRSWLLNEFLADDIIQFGKKTGVDVSTWLK